MYLKYTILHAANLKWFPGNSDGEESVCNAVDQGSALGLERLPWRRACNAPQYSGLENPMDRGAWLVYSPRGCRESDMTEGA